jgi:hypothetical protein
MKTIQSLLILLLMSVFAIAQTPFEGTITMKMSGTQETKTEVEVDDEVVSEEKNKSEIAQTIVFHLKGEKSVMEIENPEQGMKIIMDNATGEIINIIVVNGKTQVQKMNVNSAMFKAMLQNAGEAEPFKGTIKKTGKSKMIGDYLSYEYVVNDEGGTGTLWAAPKLTINLSERVPLMKVFLKQMGGQFLKPSDEIDGFVLELKGKDDNDESVDIKINVEKKALSDDLFKMPDLTDDEKKQLDKQEKIRKLAEEYRKKMMEAKDDPQKMKELGEEFKKKMTELQQEN